MMAWESRTRRKYHVFTYRKIDEVQLSGFDNLLSILCSCRFQIDLEDRM